jgi:hypothetical protein
MPGRDLAVDEAMERFTGKSKDTLIIPSKPISEGYKIWCLAQKGYILVWCWHKKGKGKNRGPQGVVLPTELKTNPTASVVPHLISKLPTAKFHYCVYLDNLFTSTKLLKVLRDRGIGATGTCRKNSGISEDLAQKKAIDKSKDEIPWGTLFVRPSEDQQICFLAWKDNALVLFQSTITDGQSTITRERKRPSETSSAAKTARVPFGDSPTKKLSIPRFVDDYNHQMNAVDQADQLRSSNAGLRRIRKGGWHAIWHFLFNVVLVNSYLLSTYSTVPETSKFTSQKEFRIALYSALISKATKASTKRQLEVNSSSKDTLPFSHTVELMGKQRACYVCKEKGVQRVPRKRQVLSEISANSRPIKRTRETTWGCKACQVFLCNSNDCFGWYHKNIAQ